MYVDDGILIVNLVYGGLIVAKKKQPTTYFTSVQSLFWIIFKLFNIQQGNIVQPS